MHREKFQDILNFDYTFLQNAACGPVPRVGKPTKQSIPDLQPMLLPLPPERQKD